LNEVEAKVLLGKAFQVVVPLVRRYEAGFHLDEIVQSRYLRRKNRTQPIDESDASDSNINDANVLPVDSRY